MNSPTSLSSDNALIVANSVNRYGARKDALVQVLREVQVQMHWLSPETLALVAKHLDLSSAIVTGVASFYRFFHLQPVAPLHFLWSDNITDRMLGNHNLADEFCRLLNISAESPDPEAPASMQYTSCTGLGDQGPAVLLNQHRVLTRLTRQRIIDLTDLILNGAPVSDWPSEWQQVDDQLMRADVLLQASPMRGEALQALLAQDNDIGLTHLERSGLRGRGGAGFSTHTKWQACKMSTIREGGTRVVVCNADEGEPGTFKDRVLMTQQADTLFEGMTVAARLIGASKGFVYLRGEYRYLLEHLLAVLEKRRADDLLGIRVQGVEGFNFDIEVHLGAGAYVCGEESALIESLEGKRGTPRIRPPFPVERGYLDQPTIVNNVETFMAAAHITLSGGDWWAGIGTDQSSGTKVHSVSGDCARPGIYEYPFGVTIQKILDDCGAGSQVQAVQVGGPSGVCLAAHEFDRQICFEDVPSAGAFMIFNQQRDMFETARCFAHFFAHESCGFCTPCRVGTAMVARRMDKLANGYGSLFDEAELQELEALLHTTTHCGLGATATNPLRDTLAKFRPAYEQRLQSPVFQPGFDLDAELESARRVTGRNDDSAHLEQRT